MKQLIKSAAVVLTGLLVSCAFEPGFPAQTGPGVQIETSVNEYLSRKDVLALSHLQTEHVVGEEKLKTLVLDFIGGGNTPGRSAVSPGPVITGLTKLEGKGFGSPGNNARMSLGNPDPAEIPFYVFTIENREEGTLGFALTCGDDRIGNVLAVVEKGVYDDMENPFLPIFYSYLDQYIGNTIDIYNSITEEDINAALAKSGSSPAPVTRSVLPIIDDMFFYDIESVKDMGIPLLKTYWGQGYPYNALVSSALGGSYPTGCVATAMAQIMAYHKFPNNWYNNGVPLARYNWDAMISGRADNGVATLMVEIGQRVQMGYSPNGSNTDADNIAGAFVNMGYISSSFMSFNPAHIMTSINSGCPVLINGYDTKTVTLSFLGIPIKTKYTGHTWIIDGFRSRYLVVNKTIVNLQNPMQYVHCNLGWDGYCDGWYLGDVFYAAPGMIPEPDPPVQQRSQTPNNYQYKLEIMPYVYPNPALQNMGY
ncbi:putative pyrogenic exotoxin B [Treponema primitia ZAS-2]|uniref:Putative pyrogenic exotoxin B n=1 Tax=Treponema primitia (strain ATCC BAA-887 / DSM 12427 / ZAS-2) TaxID=545694 RepID=F5YII7_TREPZ|nr:C10 family peptidase [Treponema primitia]AEF84858.1 putative pyrogenic exotoxin B [Treponema primitia ZAS-2]